MSRFGEPDWLGKGLDHIWLPYAQMKTATRPTGVAATRGSRITLSDGRELIDGVGSWWTAVHGYNHPALIGAAKDQLDSVPHAMLGGLANEPAYRLADRLSDITSGDLSHVFFSESGSVAVEVAMKIAVQYWLNKAGERRTRFVSFLGGYHGDTFMTMSVCDPEEGMHALFADVLPAQHIAALPETEDAAAQLERILESATDIAAVMVEPLIQGAGGMRMHDAETLRRLREMCDRHGVLLIFDEIFTGFGRTGAMFAADKAGVVPDIMTLGKALTGGITPLAATIASGEVFAAFYDDNPGHALMHGPTYSGHALACAVANASLDLFASEPRLEQVAEIENHLKVALQPLAESPSVASVRVTGAVGAVDLKGAYEVEAARARFIERGVFIRPLGNTVYVSPAYTITVEELRTLTDAIAEEVEYISR